MPERSRSIGCGLSFARTCQGRLLAGALFSVFALLPAGCRRHTSDKTMISFFHEHEGAFERLVNFAQHDAELHAVTRANVCVKRGEQDWTTGGPQLIARKRWSDYQALFRELELPDGFAKDDSKISFTLDRVSLWNGDSAKGFVYSVDALPTCAGDLGACEPQSRDRFGYIIYRQIKPHWYLWLHQN